MFLSAIFSVALTLREFVFATLFSDRSPPPPQLEITPEHPIDLLLNLAEQMIITSKPADLSETSCVITQICGSLASLAALTRNQKITKKVICAISSIASKLASSSCGLCHTNAAAMAEMIVPLIPDCSVEVGDKDK